MTAEPAGDPRSETSGGGRPHRQHEQSPPGPDLAAAARDAVIIYLHDASANPAGTGIEPADIEPASGLEALAATATLGQLPALGHMPAILDDGDQLAPDPSTPESEAWRAAAMSVAALDRIEAAAAKMEADIAAAVQVQMELRAGAGAAAESAVQAALEAWEAAGEAVAAEGRAAIILRRIEQYLTIAVGLVLFAIVVVVVASIASR